MKKKNKKSRRNRKQKQDVFQLARSIGERVTSKEIPPKEPREKNAAAVSLGRLGGLKGGKVRAENLSSEKRREIAIKAAKARWAKK